MKSFAPARMTTHILRYFRCHYLLLQIFFCYLAISLFIPITLFAQNIAPYRSWSESNSPAHWMFQNDYDTVNGSWTRIAPLNMPLYGVLSYYWQDSGKVFICGGADSAGTPHPLCFFYDPASNTYSEKAPLPTGRALGKLVRVKDSLYLVGSVGLWHSPDGAIYKYDPHSNLWTVKDTMPRPFVHEPAVCVWRDSLIITVGGSTNDFIAPTNIVRVYNPFTRVWRTIQNSYPMVVTTADAECLADTLIVFGGVGTDYLNIVYHGYIIRSDTTFTINWNQFEPTPYGIGVYRVGGGKWYNPASGIDVLLFGPAMRSHDVFNKIWGYTLNQDSQWVWINFTPNTIDSAGNRTTIAVRQDDSAHFYLSGGYKYPNVIASSEQYSFQPAPIGIASNKENMPENFSLEQNYPNPFNPSTKIKYQISKRADVRLILYDALGKEIDILVNARLNPGTYETEWEGTNYAAGIYFYKLEVSGNFITKKMVLLK